MSKKLEAAIVYFADVMQKEHFITALECMHRSAPEANEALTCEGCHFQKREGWNYESCIKCSRHWGDNYRCSPAGGEG